MNEIQECMNEYKESASCFAFIRQKLSPSFSTVDMTWDMTDNALYAVRLLSPFSPV